MLTAPNRELIPSLLKGLAPLGKLLILAAMDGPAEVDSNTMLGKGLSVTAWPSGHAKDSEDTIKFAQTHGVDCMIEKFTLDQANEAMEKMEGGKVRFRYLPCLHSRAFAVANITIEVSWNRTSEAPSRTLERAANLQE